MSSNTDPTTFTELFRAALMRKHSDEWDMETVSEAAHICAAVASQAIAEAVEAARIDEVVQFRGSLKRDENWSEYSLNRLDALRNPQPLKENQ